MTYVRPPFLVRRVFNPIAMATGVGGSETLVVRRRSSGGEQRIPVIPVEHEGHRYIVSARGETQWVRNLRAAGAGELRRRRARQPFTPVEVPVEERPPVIALYRAKAGKTVAPFWQLLPDPADHPVFRLDPA